MPVGADLVLVLIVVLLIVLLWRGPKTLPSLGTAFGQAIKGARDAARDVGGRRDDEATGTTSATAEPVIPSPTATPGTVPPVQPTAPVGPPPAPVAPGPAVGPGSPPREPDSGASGGPSN